MTRCVSRWWMAAALAAAATGCVHAERVGTPQQAAQDEADREGAPAKKEEGASGRETRARVPPRDGRPAVSATPEGLMNPGSAARIQQALASRHYLSEKSGQLDEATSAALRRFQQDQGLAPTGAPDRETLQRLGVDPQEVYQTGRPQ